MSRRVGLLLAAALVVGFVSGAGFFRFVIATLTPGGEAAPADRALYLTWLGDPTTTMTVSWLTEEKDSAPLVLFRAAGETTWREASGRAERFPHTVWDLHRVELTGLQPGGRYDLFVPGESRMHHFRTLPAKLEEPLRFCAGGDVGDDFEVMDRMNRLAGGRDPAFVVWGGDLAYCDGRPEKAWRWRRFFQSVHRHLRGADGRLVPLVVAPGNHEVNKNGGDDRADCYLAAFPRTDGKTFGAFDAGDYLSLLLLDTAHLSPIEGPQTDWLSGALASRRGRPHVFPVYHAGAYPSVRDPGRNEASAVRKHWVPLFEEHGVRLAFEHHDHAFKITHPLRRGRVDEAGIVYVGDGAWGVETRQVLREREGYLAKASPAQHFHEVVLEPGRRIVRSRSIEGAELHAFEQAVGDPAEISASSSSSRHFDGP